MLRTWFWPKECFPIRNSGASCEPRPLQAAFPACSFSGRMPSRIAHANVTVEKTVWKPCDCRIFTASRIGSGEKIWITLPKPCSSSRNIETAPATASADKVRITADVRLRGANRSKLANSNASQKIRSPTKKRGGSFPPTAERVTTARRRFWPLGSYPDRATIGRGDLPASAHGPCPQRAGATRKSMDYQVAHSRRREQVGSFVFGIMSHA